VEHDALSGANGYSGGDLARALDVAQRKVAEGVKVAAVHKAENERLKVELLQARQQVI